ncbi:DUF4864 domain-containing protein [Methyloligella sp. 2.7D]|uniref:DUF4864 domain-containing protein n=1 Tax=unclassified Methyloligella TaxID=2625955 RepID=UPI00157C46CA|nr:DUF4864 domain-containing protein [Methyloligella sp. GL2]QKP77698.1 DUF4864 domain-containing protein [Methyloligella sp. GL2]
MKSQKKKVSVLAAFMLFFSTTLAIGQEATAQDLASTEPGVTSPELKIAKRMPSNVTIVPKTPLHATVSQAIPVITGKEKAVIEDTVRMQIKALSKGDAEGAFANLSPSTQRYFGGATAFLTEVRHEAAPVTKTQSFSFLNLERRDAETLQPVLLTDKRGQSWLAKFRLERQGAGDWRVLSCEIEAIPGQQA